MVLLAEIENVRVYTETCYEPRDELIFKQQLKNPSIWFEGNRCVGWTPLSKIKRLNYKMAKILNKAGFQIINTTDFDSKLKIALKDVIITIRENIKSIFNKQYNYATKEEEKSFKDAFEYLNNILKTK